MADWRQNTVTGIGDPVSAYYYYYSNLQCHVEYHMYAVVPYMHGLASGDFELALRGLLGEQAPLSASTVARAKERWQAEYSEWQQRPIEDEIGYLWLDGVYLKAGLEQEKAALLVAIGVKADGHKVVLAVTSGYRESTASWSALLRDLKARGMHEPRLLVGDGNLGLWSALRNIFPGAEEQRCWNHRLVNLLTQVPKQRQGEARELLTKIPYQTSARQGRQKQRVFQNWCLDHGYERAAELIDENWEQMVSFYRFPRGHWRHLRTSNVVESPPTQRRRFPSCWIGSPRGDLSSAVASRTSYAPQATQSGARSHVRCLGMNAAGGAHLRFDLDEDIVGDVDHFDRRADRFASPFTKGYNQRSECISSLPVARHDFRELSLRYSKYDQFKSEIQHFTQHSFFSDAERNIRGLERLQNSVAVSLMKQCFRPQPHRLPIDPDIVKVLQGAVFLLERIGRKQSFCRSADSDLNESCVNQRSGDLYLQVRRVTVSVTLDDVLTGCDCSNPIAKLPLCNSLAKERHGDLYLQVWRLTGTVALYHLLTRCNFSRPIAELPLRNSLADQRRGDLHLNLRRVADFESLDQRVERGHRCSELAQ